MPRKRKPETVLPRKATGLELPWPSSPLRKPRYALYCDHVSGRHWTTNSFGIYAIKKIYDGLIGTGKGVLQGEDTIRFGDVTIRSDELKEIIAHKYSPEEAEWVLPTPYPETTSQFLTGVRRPR